MTKEINVEELAKENALLREQIAQMNEFQQGLVQRVEAVESKSSDTIPDEEDVPDAVTSRQPVKFHRLATYKGSPVISIKLSNKYTRDGNGRDIVASTDADIVTLDGTKAKIPYGTELPEDFIKLPSEKFALVNQISENGASKIEKGVVVYRGGVVAEQSTEGGQIHPTGRMVRQVVTRDIHYYTILVDGKEHTLSEDQLIRN